jgi:hypothetical protein
MAANGNAVGTISFPSLNPNSETAFYVGSLLTIQVLTCRKYKKTEITTTVFLAPKDTLTTSSSLPSVNCKATANNFIFNMINLLVLALYHIVFLINTSLDVTDIFNASKIENSGQSTLIF